MSRTPDAEMRAHIRRAALQAERLSGKGADRIGARAVLQWLDDTDADPPPNTERVQVLMDVSPVLGGAYGGKRVVYVTKIDECLDQAQIAGTKLEPGWRRSIGVLYAPVPEPIAVVRGVVEVVS